MGKTGGDVFLTEQMQACVRLFFERYENWWRGTYTGRDTDLNVMTSRFGAIVGPSVARLRKQWAIILRHHMDYELEGRGGHEVLLHNLQNQGKGAILRWAREELTRQCVEGKKMHPSMFEQSLDALEGILIGLVGQRMETFDAVTWHLTLHARLIEEDKELLEGVNAEA